MEPRMNDMPMDQGDRAAEIVDLFSNGRGGGQNHGVHRVLQSLARNERGGALPILANVLLIISHDPPLSGMLGYNEFTSQSLLMRAAPPAEDGAKPLPGPYPRPWGPEDVALVQAYLQRVWASKIGRQTVEDAMLACAASNRFHPVQDWLSRLQWDGKKRIDSWLVNAFDCDNSPYHSAVGAKFLIAAVRRIRHPGTKFDHLPVLEGSQGIGKSRACKALFGDSWFSDSIPPDLTSRDAAMALLGIWCLEFAEIEHLIRSEVETIKAFLSRSVDRYRPPYGKTYIERPRQGVLIGTTNSSDYLRDTTGNRRIWPITCRSADPEWVAVNRDQLWAEAVIRESANEAIWLEDYTVREAASEAQTNRMTEDVWADTISLWLHNSGWRGEVRTGQVLSEALNIPKDRQGRREEMRVAAIMTAEGWKRTVRKNRERNSYKVWIPPMAGPSSTGHER